MIYLPPFTSAIQLTVNSAMPGCTAVRYDDEITFTLLRKGCDTEILTDFIISESWPEFTIRLAEVSDSIKRGYYEGYLTIGCEETCRIDFFVGQNLCFDARAECGDTLIGKPTCEVSECNSCKGGVLVRDYKIIERYKGGITLLADDAGCFDVPECEVCPEC